MQVFTQNHGITNEESQLFEQYLIKESIFIWDHLDIT